MSRIGTALAFVALVVLAWSATGADGTSVDDSPPPTSTTSVASTTPTGVAEPAGEPEGTVYRFHGSYCIERSGGHAHGLRVRARRHSYSPSSLRGLVLWA